MSHEIDEIEITTAAQAGHEAVRIYCERRGDFRHFPWNVLGADQKLPARHGALGVIVENHTPEQSHESWRMHRTALGWRYGRIYSVSVKEHPCMVPWAELSFEEQAKNVLFVSVVRAMAAALRSIPNQ
jgi:hypothetical protein